MKKVLASIVIAFVVFATVNVGTVFSMSTTLVNNEIDAVTNTVTMRK